MPSHPRDPGFAVYVHWPFCQSKCPYCDFNSHVRQAGVDQKDFLQAYLAELDYTATLIAPQKVKSVFFGGGTPSLMEPETVEAILNKINALWPFEADVEITLEANPSSVEAARFAGYRTAGVNRVSLGIQALNDADLKALGRLHSLEEAEKALQIAQQTFERVSFDLIYARPQQSPESWRSELQKALEKGVSHLSLYQLTIEPGTRFADLYKAGKLTVPEGEIAEEHYFITQELCEKAGLPAYEISNHARAGQESRHNLVYWEYGIYTGIGPGAHGRLEVGAERYATSTERNPEIWRQKVQAKGHGLIEYEPLTKEQQADEMLLMGLRLQKGVDLQRLEVLTGYHLEQMKIDTLEAKGLVKRKGPWLSVTEQGRFVLNSMIAEIAEALVKV